MLNKLCAALREEKMILPGDRVTCAVSGGADSIALLFGMYLLKDKLGITLGAAVPSSPEKEHSAGESETPGAAGGAGSSRKRNAALYPP